MEENPTTYFIDLYGSGFVTSSSSYDDDVRRQIVGPLKGRLCHEKSYGRRGSITGFSRHSARRLREFLLTHKMPENEHFMKVAITYTVNSEFEKENWLFTILVYSEYLTEKRLSWCLCCIDEKFRNDFVNVRFWQLLLKRWRQYLLRAGLVCVWRIELQRSGEPHLHCVGYARNVDDVSAYWEAWVRACDVSGYNGIMLSSYIGFLIHGFLCTYIKSSRWYAYVAAHCSKHKTEQIGWQGRQWGVVNRQKMEEDVSQRLVMSPRVASQVARCIRRRFHYDSYHKDLLGSRLFVGFTDIKRLVDYFSLYDTPF